MDHRRQRRFFPTSGSRSYLLRPCFGGPPLNATLAVAFVFLAATLLFGSPSLPLGNPFGLGALFLFLQLPLFPMTSGGIFLPFLMRTQ